MKRTKDRSKAPGAPIAAADRVSLRAIYSEAMREVMADPRKAIAEHDPWLAALMLLPGVAGTPSKG